MDRGKDALMREGRESGTALRCMGGRGEARQATWG